MKTEQPNSQSIVVWELPVRVFHWLLVALVAVAWITGEGEGSWFVVHLFAGYGIMVAVLFRLIWGFMGSPHARFRDFVHPWHTVRDYARRLLAMNPPRTVGHNPLGGWMILLLLGSLVGLVLSGLFAADDEVAGPLAVYATPGIAHTLAELHEGMAVFLLVLIAIHVAGVLVDSLLTGDNLIRAMLTGRKHVMSDETGADAEQKSPRVPAWRAVVALATATGLTWLVTTI